MSLHNSRGTIAIYDQSRQVVALTMHQSESVVMGIVGYAYALTHRESRSEALTPKSIINNDILKREHPHGNRAYLPMPHSNEVAGAGDDTHRLTFGNAVIDMTDCSGEYPRMKSEERLFFSFL